MTARCSLRQFEEVSEAGADCCSAQPLPLEMTLCSEIRFEEWCLVMLLVIVVAEVVVAEEQKSLVLLPVRG